MSLSSGDVGTCGYTEDTSCSPCLGEQGQVWAKVANPLLLFTVPPAAAKLLMHPLASRPMIQSARLYSVHLSG